ncbi:intercellular adhesin biosynthesis polysaccharide N-deacetylase, partial [Staphylococcus aureus]
TAFSFRHFPTFYNRHLHGLMNDDKLPVIKKAGLKYGFSLEEKAVTPNSNDYYIPRILISDDAFEHLIKRWDGFHEKD